MSGDTIYECIAVVEIEYQAFWAGAKGAVYSGVCGLSPGQRVGLYPPTEAFANIERSIVTAVPDPSIHFEQRCVPEAIREEKDGRGEKRFNGVILFITKQQLNEQFKLVEGAGAV